MKRILFWVVFFVLPGLVVFAEERNYTKIVKDNNGNPILKITCEYIGKQPVGDFKFSVDWQKRSVDFYDLVFENLTGKPVEFTRIKSYHKYGNYMIRHKNLPDGKVTEEKVPNIKTTDLKKDPLYDGNIIGPFGKKLRKNYFYYGGRKYHKNIWYQDWTIKYGSEEHTFTTYNVYEK